ncbi:hypothetical protein LOTGIDRAFT_235864 [Lottia gigantea]|uniref:DUF19 domain-containing protein n=1 Tax=Lottia gigantea TaxID=225164 RepID=V3ZW74_LOTGI|nr:hypothetical protein LOTGIDRAFT_235864 [Lottia gigantea]ESO85206.1 hypothetical protein LOTGIDRAFT_235864 [Lottia gigantea]
MFLRLIFCAVIGIYGVNGQLSECLDKILTEDCDNSNTSPSLSQFYSNPTEELCSKKGEVVSYLKCVNDATKKCYDEKFKALFATDEMNEKSVNYLCSRINSYNATCLQRSNEKLSSCFGKGLKKLSSNPTYDEMKAFGCAKKKNTKKCIEESKDFDKCPETRKSYLEVNKITNTEACGGEDGFESGVFGVASTVIPLYKSFALLTTIMTLQFIFV